jgi:uncharacterized membrane protein
MTAAVSHTLLTDLVAPVIAATIIGGYHLWLRHRTRHNPAYTVQSVHAIARTAWVESVMTKGRDILAIQTLRNSTMSATFLASTAILLLVGVLTLSGQGDKLQVSWGALDAFSGTDPSLWDMKLLALIVNLSVAFFSFTLSIRKFHHVGYLLNVPEELRHPCITPAFVGAYLNGAGRSYSLGMRAYYMLLPLVFWLFGPIFMVSASVGLVAILYRLDRATDELESVPQVDIPAVGEPESRAEPSGEIFPFTPKVSGRMAGAH